MRCIPPLTITDAMLTSSTIAEPAPGETVWAAATSYTLNAIVARTTTHRLYQNLIAGVDATLPENAPTRWLDIGPTNRWAMFDTLRNSATSATTSMTIVLTPGKRVDSIALMAVVGETATVTVTSGGSTVYTSTDTLVQRSTTSWFTYFFGAFKFQGSVIHFDLPPYTNAVITITISRASGTVSCGALVIGQAVYVGQVLSQAKSDALNFSTVTRDQFGNATLMPRRTIPSTDLQLIIDAQLVDSLLDLRSSLNAVPAVWSGLDDLTANPFFEALLILGVYKQFPIKLKTPLSDVSLTLEEI